MSRTMNLLRWLSSTCYTFQRSYWSKVWPFPRGFGLPATIAKRLTNVPLWVELQLGVKMLLDPRDLICRVLLETGEWDAATWRAIAAHLRPGGTFIDVGAHMGYCSLMAATLVGSEGRVVAIEANPEMVEYLGRNIHASKAAVTVQPVACCDSEMPVDLFVASHANSGSSSISKENASRAGASQRSYRVQARPLDAILNELGISRVDLLKIDVEGAELQVLRSAKDTLARDRPVLMIELDDQLLNAMGTSSADIRNLLASYGYNPDGTFDDANVRFLPTAVRAQSEAPLMSKIEG